MSKIDLGSMFDIVPAGNKLGKTNFVIRGQVHPLLENPYIKAAMIENDELAVQLIDLLTDGIPNQDQTAEQIAEEIAEPKHINTHDFVADGVDITYTRYNDAKPFEQISFYLGDKADGITLTCFCDGFSRKIHFQYRYSGKSLTTAYRVFGSTAGEPLAEQVALPGFLSIFGNMRLECGSRCELEDEWRVYWELSLI